MTTGDPRSLSFAVLDSYLKAPYVSADQAQALLDDHYEELFRVLSVKPEGTVTDEAVKYRPGIATTLSNPQPTAAELVHIESIRKSLGISAAEAALVLRDYLLEDFGSDSAVAKLASGVSLASVAPVDKLEEFSRHERHSACLILVSLFVQASERSAALAKVYCDFLTEHSDVIDAIIKDRAIEALWRFGDGALAAELRGAGTIEPFWAMEMLFASVVFRGSLKPETHVALVDVYAAIPKENAVSSRLVGMDYSQADHCQAYMDGNAATALFVAALNKSLGLAPLMLAQAQLLAGSTEIDFDEIGASDLSDDAEAAEKIDRVLGGLPESELAETCMLRFSWSSFLRMRVPLGNWVSEEDLEGKEIFDPMKHMSSAMSGDVFRSMRALMESDLSNVDSSLRAALSLCFWIDLCAFLTAFPPQNFSPIQVEVIIDLAKCILRDADGPTITDISESAWSREETASEFVGANAMLRLACGVFPQTFRPLLSLLTTFTVDSGTADCAHDLLTNRLVTLTESADGYADQLLCLDEEDTDILEQMGSTHLQGVPDIVRTMSMVAPALGDMVYVQASGELPADSYRPALARGTIGVASHDLGVVTWAVQWDGFGALYHILNVLAQLLGKHDANSTYEEYVLDELISSALAGLKLMDRLCRTGSADLRDLMLAHVGPVATVADIVTEVADPGDWAQGSWLTKRRRELLLTASSSCLASMVLGSLDRSQYALDRLGASQNVQPMQAAIAALGVASFPAIGAVSRIAGLCLRESQLPDAVALALASASRPPERSRAATKAGAGSSSPDSVLDFMRGVALPLWLTTALGNERSTVSDSLYWLLPACGLELFCDRPSEFLHGPEVASVLSAVLTASASSLTTQGFRSNATNTFLFPALRAGLVLCYEGLRQRNADLQEGELLRAEARGEGEPSKQSHLAEFRRKGSAPGFAMGEMSAMEKILVKPDVIHAMAALASGCAHLLDSDDFFEQWRESEFRSLLSKNDDDRYLSLSASSADVKARLVCSWKTWVEDMAARCLSLQFCCLAFFADERDVIQVPWPTMGRSSLGYWRGGGEQIRAGFASRISGDQSVACIELLVCVLSCGQRAAARALLGPRPANANVSETVAQDVVEGSTRKSTAHLTTENVAKENDVLAAVVSTLRAARDAWVRETQAENDEGSNGSSDDANSTENAGQLSLVIAGCVRMLRTAWEAHGSVWFRECWNLLEVWDLMASLLRCEGAGVKAAGRLDMSLAVRGSYEFLRQAGDEDNDMEDMSDGDAEDDEDHAALVRRIALSTDSVSAWRTAVADTLDTFASEILFRASEAAASKSIAAASTAEGADATKDVSAEAAIFNEPVFVAFGSVFTERWMHILLQPENWSCACVREIDAAPFGDTAVQGDLRRFGSSGSAQHSTRTVEWSLEAITEALSTKVGVALGLDYEHAKDAQILSCFRQHGEARLRFGAAYAFDVVSVWSCVKRTGVDDATAEELLKRLLCLNAVWNRVDIQLSLTRAYAAMTAAVIVADTLAPSPGVALAYSSPQFGGKLVRCLARFIVCMRPLPSLSGVAAVLQTEMAMMMAFLSARLTAEELDQPALTAVRFEPSPKDNDHECSLSPLAQVCLAIDRAIPGLREDIHAHRIEGTGIRVSQWLLLVAARVVHGSAFRRAHDITTLGKTSLTALQCGSGHAGVAAAASVAISALLENVPDELPLSLSKLDAMTTIFGAVSSLSRSAAKAAATIAPKRSSSSGEAAPSVVMAVSNLLLVLSRLVLLQSMSVLSLEGASVLRHLSGGSISSILPPNKNPVPTYNPVSLTREPAHLVWCSALTLSSAAMARFRDGTGIRGVEQEQHVRDVLEFAASNMHRIVCESLNLSGDWPLLGENVGDVVGGASLQGQDGLHAPRHITIARVEEAELAAEALFQISGYSLQLQDTLPELVQLIVSETTRFVYQAYRLIRAEPVERWVHPVTQQERERSEILAGARESSNVAAIYSYASSPWAGSPSTPGHPGSGSSPRRSPSQALRAAIGGSGLTKSGSGGSANRAAHGLVPPSPGMPSTPQYQSPMSIGTGRLTAGPSSNFLSPSSPWGPHGTGLITKTGLFFGDETSRALLRALSAALGALRRFASTLDILLFAPTMQLSEEDPGLGVLVALQYHACNEIQRGAEGERRDVLVLIVDNALHMTLSHVAAYSDQGLLTPGVRDELRKRVSTVVMKLRSAVPPPPSFSIVHSREIDTFFQQLK